MKHANKNSKTGHGKNVANFKDLIAACRDYGADYRPTNQRLAITALETQAVSTDNAVKAAGAADKHLAEAIALRAAAFKGVKPLCTRIMGAFESSDEIPDGILDTAHGINRRIQGQASPDTLRKERAAHKAAAAQAAGTPDAGIPEETAGTHAHQSYFRTVESLSDLQTLMGQVSAYGPAEADLRSDSLGTLVQKLSAANDSVRDAGRALSAAMIVRNRLLYDQTAGLVSTAAKVKQYVKSVYHATAPEFGQIKSLAFRRIKG